jgi:eukaryotic-like serine/threonine-protein kinase
LRSLVADYEVIQALPSTVAGQVRFLCRPPVRLGLDATPVEVTELAIDATGWRELADGVSRLAGVRSANVVRLFEVGPDLDPDGAGVYLVTEWAPGGSTDDPTEPLDSSGRIRAVAQAAQGAHALHEAGVAHGSINRGSILLAERGAVLGIPALGRPPGTVTTMRSWRDLVALDPALLRGEEPSRSSDIWALAATLHGLLSDTPLYPDIDDDPDVTAVQRILFTRPEVDPRLPADVGAILVACLADDPAERVQTAADLSERLLASEAGR